MNEVQKEVFLKCLIFKHILCKVTQTSYHKNASLISIWLILSCLLGKEPLGQNTESQFRSLHIHFTLWKCSPFRSMYTDTPLLLESCFFFFSLVYILFPYKLCFSLMHILKLKSILTSWGHKILSSLYSDLLDIGWWIFFIKT